MLSIWLAISKWRSIRLFLSDLLRLFGFLGKFVRRKSVEDKYEGIINSAVKSYNSNFEDTILPKCEINWINEETQDSYFDAEGNKAIVCLRFDKRNQDLNFHNA